MSAARVVRSGRVGTVLLGVVVVLLLSLWMPARSSASTPTQITATPLLADLVPGANLPLGLVLARLTAGGSPVASKALTFSAHGAPECVTATGPNGLAWCKFSWNGILSAIQATGYQVSFAGDSDFQASTVRGPLVSIAGIGL
jgi:hypothetical protein